MPRLRVNGRYTALCDVIILALLLSLGALFWGLYSEITTRNSRNSAAVVIVTSFDRESPREPLEAGVAAGDRRVMSALSEQTLSDAVRRLPDTRPEFCRTHELHQQLPVASIVIVFSDYEFYDAKLTLTSILRDAAQLSSLISEILLVDDASNSQQVLQDAQTYIRAVSRSFPGVRLVRLGMRAGRVRARSLAVQSHVTNDVVVCVDAGVVCMPGWLSPLLELVGSSSDGQTTIAVPHSDHLTHPVTLDYEATQHDLVAALSWSLSIRMRRQDTSSQSQHQDQQGAGLWRSAPVLRGEVLAVRRTFLASIGGLYDSALEYGTGTAEHVELSLRTWLCGGYIKVRLV